MTSIRTHGRAIPEPLRLLRALPRLLALPSRGGTGRIFVAVGSSKEDEGPGMSLELPTKGRGMCGG